MSAFEIAITVILSFTALWVSMLCFQASFFLDRKMNRQENEKKSAPKNEADKNI